MSKLMKFTFKLLDLIVIFVMTFNAPIGVLAAQVNQEPAPMLATDKSEYVPGEMVYVSGSNFASGDYTLAAMDPGGNPVSWGATGADADGYILYSTEVELAGSYELRAYPAGWSGNWSETAVAGTSFTVASVEPAPMVESDRPDYVPSDTVILTGNNWQGDAQVKLFVNDDLGQTWKREGVVNVNEDGTFTDSFTLPDWFVATYTVSATGQQTGRQVKWTFTDSAIMLVDDNGPDDYPGQKDLNFLTVDYNPPTSGTILVSWGWDDTAWSGNNTGDACTLFDTDADGFANYAFCVTVEKSPAVFKAARLYSCGDTRADRCDQPTTLIQNFTSTATAGVVANSDPFGVPSSSYYNASHVTGNTCDARTGCYTADTVANVVVNLSDVGGGAAKLINVCSYPSQEPNSAPSECVVTPNNGFLTIVKSATPNDGTPFTFNLGTGQTSQNGTKSWTINGSGSVQLISFAPGTTYDLSEVIPTGWDLNSASCAVQTNPATATGTFSNPTINDFTVQSGLETICTFNDVKRGTIIIVKKTTGGDDTFNYTGTLGAFSLTTVNGTATQTFNDKVPGTYSVAETVPTGWDLTSATCSDGSLPSAIDLSAGESVTCTFNNQRQAVHLKLVKNVTNDNGGIAAATDWTLTATGSGSNVYSGAGGFDLDVAPDTYTLSESSLQGYTAGSWVCTGGTFTAPDKIALTYGQSATCTITNDDQAATLIVKKVVINDNGGTLAATDFSFSVNGGAAVAFEADGQNDLPVPAGTYTVTEPAVSGYTTTYDNCSNLVIPNGGTATCTITNDDQAATLHVVKVVVNDDGGTKTVSDFSFSVNGGSAIAFEADGQNDLTVPAGTYSVTEPAVSGYTTTYNNCSDLVIPNGGSATCTITNNDQAGTLIVKKLVINDNGGTKVATDFAFTVDGGTAIPFEKDGTDDKGIKVLSVAAGTYDVVEAGLPIAGYTTGYLQGQNTFTCEPIVVKNGETSTCTITNDDIAPTLKVIKVLVPSSDPGKFSLLIDGQTQATDVGDGGTTGFVAVNAGPHTVGEIAGTGTDLSDYVTTISGDCNPDGTITLALAENKTCTITNTRRATLIIVKDALPDDAQDFSFTTTGTGLSNFKLDDDADPTLSNTVTFGKLVPGSYSVAEDPLTGWELTGATCDTGNDPSAITLNAGDTVTCTFTNKKVSIDITKIADAATVSAGDTIGFVINVTSSGTGTAQNVTVTDTLPTNTGLLWTIDAANSDTGCSIAGGVLTCAFGSMAGGTSKSVHITSPTTADSCGTVANSASVATSNDGSSQAGASITVNCAQIELTKTADANTVNAGDNIGFTITVSNSGAGTAYNVSVSDTLPTNTGLSWTIDPAVQGCAIAAGVLTCNFATLAPQASISIHVTSPTTPATCGTVENTASATTGNDGSAQAGDAITVQCPNLTVLKTADNGTINAGDTASFTIVVSNSGAGTAYGVTLTDTLPAGIIWSEDSADCSITGGVLSCNFGSLAGGATRTIHVSGLTSPAVCGVLANTATVAASNEAKTDDNASSATITVNCPDLTVEKTGNGPINANDTALYTITVTNTGAGAAYNVTLSDQLPAGIIWSVDNQACTIDPNNLLTCSFGTLAAGASITIHASGTAPSTVCGTLNNTVTVAAGNEGNTDNNSATASILVNCAVIEITKTGISPISAGDTLSYTITVSNTGAGTAYGVTLTDTLPTTAGLGPWTVTPGGPTCTITSGVLNCSLGDMPAGTNQIITLSSPTTYASCGKITNVASVATTNDGSGQASADVTVLCPNLEITKTADAGSVSAGDPIGFTITVTNTGDGIARNVTLSDTLPAASGINWSIDPASVECSIANGVLSCSFEDLKPGAIRSVHITSPTTKDSCTTYHNSATASADNQLPVTAGPVGIDVLCASISIEKIADADVVSAGDPIGFQIVVTNTGSGNAYDVTVTDTLPTNAGLNWTITAQSSGTPLPCSISGGVLTCNFGTIAAGMNKSVRISSPTTAASCGTVENTASVTTTNDGSDSAGDSLTVNCPDLTIVKTPDAGSVNAGDPIGFTITVQNTGLGKAYGVTLSDTLPTSAGTNWTIDPAVSGCSIDNGVLTCSIGTLDPNATFSVHLSSPTSAATCGGTVDNTATVTATNEASTGNNSSSASITVNCPDLSVTKEPVTGTINAGDTAAFKIVVTNSGPGTAYAVTLTDTLPAGVAWTIDPPVSGCSIAGNTLSCSFASLAASASVEIKVSGATSPAVCGKLDNTVTVAATNEANTSNNTATATITVNCPDLTVTKQAVSGSINAGDTAAFKIVVTNSGAGTAYNVTLNDSLPAGVTWTIDPPVPGCSIASGVLSCSFASLASSASIEINVSGTTTAAVCGKLDNMVTVAASNEASTGNNSSSASITVNCPDLTVTKQAVSGTINAGDTAAFKIVLTNSGAGTAYNVTLNDTLPAGVTWTIDPAVTGCSITGDTLSCSFASLAAGDSLEIQVSGATSAAVCGKLDNIVTVAASNEADASNNSASASITVNCPDVKVVKTADKGTIDAGTLASFTLLVSNTGAGTAYNVTLNDTLPAGVTWTIDPAVTGCSISGGVLSCSFASLASGASIEIHVSGMTDAPDCGTLSNTATVAAANEASAALGNNSSTANISVLCGNIVVKKVTVGGDGNFDFTPSFGQGFSLMNGQSHDSGALAPGTYSVAETVPSGWDLTSAVCDDGSPVGAISLQGSETVTCTFTNTRRGTIVITKEAWPDDPQDFAFTATETTDTPIPDFTLDDDADNTLPKTLTFSDLKPGDYTVTEALVSGWDLTGMSCSTALNSNVKLDTGTRTIGITLGAGDTVSCSFTNTKRGHIVVDKVTDPSGDPQSFSFDAQGGFSPLYVDFNLTDASAPNDQELRPGNYSVTEILPAGWDFTDLVCSDPGNDTTVSGSMATINLAAGETVHCTYTNTKRGTIIIVKDAVPNDPQDFAFTSTIPGAASFSLDDDSNATLPNKQTYNNLIPGSYSVTEGAVPGWDLTGLTCSDANGSTNPGTRTADIKLDPGETVTCTFTNTKRGTIIVEKQTSPDKAPGLFTFTGDAAGTIADNGTITVTNLVPGTYTSTETEPAGQLFKLSSIVCNDANSTGNLTTRTATFKLDPGETVRCVFTNTKNFHPGTIGFWKNWRNHYTSTQFQLLINYLKTNNAKVYNKDLVNNTTDDLTIAKADAIFNVGTKTPREQMILAQFTALKFNLAITQLQGTSGLVQKNDNLCTAGVVDVSGISGAASFFGTATPTVKQVVDAVEGRWTGKLTTNRSDWKWNLTTSQKDMLIKVLTGINEGTLVLSSGCP